MLRAEHTRLRDEYGKDLLRWKEFKALEVERSDARKRKRDEKRKRRGLSAIHDEKDSSGTTFNGLQIEVDEGRSAGKLVSASDESCPKTMRVSESTRNQGPTAVQPEVFEELVETDFEEEMAEVIVANEKVWQPSTQLPSRSQREAKENEAHHQRRRNLRSSQADASVSEDAPFVDNRSRHSVTPRDSQPLTSDIHRSRRSSTSAVAGSHLKHPEECAIPVAPHVQLARVPSTHDFALPVTPGGNSRSTRISSNTTPLTRQPSIPYLDTDGKKRAVLPSRMTPWLGGADLPSTSKGSTRARQSSIERDSFGDEDLPPLPSAVSSTPKTPLVRDRVGSTTSLRRSALTKSVSITHAADQHETPTSTRGDLKRSRDKALELRRLAKMGTNEKKEYYAAYKGNGRYLARDEM
jgi:hypothetical protein